MNQRTHNIINIIKNNPGIHAKDILVQLNEIQTKPVTKITINRELVTLISSHMITREGKGPATKYSISPSYKINSPVDMQEYFSLSPDQRQSAHSFSQDIFNTLNTIEIFNTQELQFLTQLNTQYQKNIQSLDPEIIKKEFERLLIELSWKSSQIEGNTYDLLETEFLIKEKMESKGHTKMESIMILNHKKAFDFIQKMNVKNIDIKYVQNIHDQLIQDMNISKEIRSSAVGITGTNYKPLKDQLHIKQALQTACEIVNSKKDIFSKALLINLLIAYIQPFNDGNKRTSRLAGNAVLLANDHCPLSFRSIDTLEYKKAIIIFYESNNITHFKRLFMEQFKFSVGNYFQK